MKVSELLSYGENTLKDAGITDFKTDAVLLLEYVLKKDRTYIKAHPKDEVTDEEEKAYRDFIMER